jgi:uncharacterized membrane protein YgcG
MKVTWFLLLTCIAYAFSSEAQLNSRWVTQTVIADGIIKDWGQGLNFYDSKTKLLYAVANDSNNLYLCFQEPDQMSQMRIMRAGLIINLSVKGKSKSNVTIAFPLQDQEPVSRSSEQEGGQRPDMNQIKEKFLLANTMMSIRGFATPDGIVPIHNPSGLNVAVRWDSTSRMNYEIVIPWKELIKTNFSSENVGKDISLEVTVNALQAMKPPANKGSGANGGGARGGRGGGGGGGGMRGGQGGGFNRSELFTPSSFKQKFHVAMSQ